jgi:DNA-binding NarL/FixJ family response regulator
MKRARKRVSVAVLSQHPLVLEDLKRLAARPGVEVRTHLLESGFVDSRRGGIPRAGVYILDAQGPRSLVEVLARTVLDRQPAARVIVVGERFGETESFTLLRLGAKGLLRYEEARRRLAEAVSVVAAGGFWVPRPLLSRFVDSVLAIDRGRRWLTGAAGMSGRERQVLDALLENLANKEIAARLHLSERTVKFHVSNLLSRFGVSSRSELILHCLQAPRAR